MSALAPLPGADRRAALLALADALVILGDDVHRDEVVGLIRPIADSLPFTGGFPLINPGEPLFFINSAVAAGSSGGDGFGGSGAFGAMR